MKKILLLSLIAISAFVAKAQDPMFIKEDKVVTLGVGLSTRPVIGATVDYCIADGIIDKASIGVGPYVGLGLGRYLSVAHLGARGTFHYPLVEKLDTYVGLGVGFEYWVWRYSDNDLYLEPTYFIGARYQLSEKLTVFGELGSGLGYINAGIALKL